MQKAREKIRPPKGGQNLVKVLAICHLPSLGIECFQIITLSGTFQFSDIFYNVIGGIIGILISSGIYHNKQ